MQHLIQHLPVLGGNADLDVERWLRLQQLDQRCHLDRFGAGAENQKNFFCHGSVLASSHCCTEEMRRVAMALGGKNAAQRLRHLESISALRKFCLSWRQALCVHLLNIKSRHIL